MKRIFSESYGWITPGIRAAIRKYNVSPADYDLLMSDFDIKPFNNDMTDEDVRDVLAFISQRSANGYYKPRSF